jgi:hypothetical protein
VLRFKIEREYDEEPSRTTQPTIQYRQIDLRCDQRYDKVEVSAWQCIPSRVC